VNMANMMDFIGLSLGFLLTILIFSYLLGDNPFFRLAIHIFIGVAAGYVAIVTVNNVLIPRLIIPLIQGTQGERLLSILLFIPSVFLFFKVTPLRKLGNWSVAILVGIGAAASLVTGQLPSWLELGLQQPSAVRSLAHSSLRSWVQSTAWIHRPIPSPQTAGTKQLMESSLSWEQSLP